MAADDLDGVAQLNARAFAQSWPRGSFAAALAAGDECWVMESNGKRIGHGVLSAAAAEAHLLIVCIDPALQGQGFGRALTRHLLRRAEARAAKVAFLEVRPSNHAAIVLYAKLGFREIGRRHAYYATGGPTSSGREDAIVMGLTLGANEALPSP